jgi:hypothetical protein
LPKNSKFIRKMVENYSKISLTLTSLAEENCSFGLR